MYTHSNSYMTTAEMQEQYVKHVREYERQAKYERNIVRSVPDREGSEPGVDLPTIDRCEPE